MKLKRLFRKLFYKIGTRRPTGCLANPQDQRDRIFSSPKTCLPPAVSLGQHAKVVSQGGTSSCVANALAAAIRIMERVIKPNGFPARLWIYWHSRIRHDKLPLKDEGTYIRAACKALFKNGAPDELNWPFKASKVNKQPAGFGAAMDADKRTGGEYLAIPRGNNLVSDIKKALAEGYPVVFGTVVTKSFMGGKGSSMIRRPVGEKHRGRHAMCIVGYSCKLGEQGTWFRVQNSWGKGWRDGGFCWMHKNYIDWIYSSDFTIVKGWKELRGAA